MTQVARMDIAKAQVLANQVRATQALVKVATQAPAKVANQVRVTQVLARAVVQVAHY